MKCLSKEDRGLIRRAKGDGREARGNEERRERGFRKEAIVSSSPQGMTSWSSSIKIWFIQDYWRASEASETLSGLFN